jgi:SPP1 gp7 family putative phage head morphogenesis protein
VNIFELSTAFDKALLLRDKGALHRLRDIEDNLSEALYLAYKDARKEYKDAQGTSREASAAAKRRRASMLYESIGGIVEAHAAQAVAEVGSHVMTYIETAAQQSHEMLQEQMQDAVFNHAPIEAIRKVAGFYSGENSPLEKIFKGYSEEDKALYEKTILEGLAQGYSPSKMAGILSKAVEISRARAETIMRTESLRAYREVSRETYEANSDVVEAWAWNAHLPDRRTCAVCTALHGTIWKVSVPMGTHPNCRCAMVPIVRFNDKWLNGQWQGEAWFKKQDEDYQKAVLGKAKFEAYTDKKITLRDLIGYRESETWGAVRWERSLKDALTEPRAKGAYPPVFRSAPSANPTPAKAKQAKPSVTPPQPTQSLFPSDLSAFTHVKDLGGSTGATLVKDADGVLYVMKRGSNPEHLLAEMEADTFYRAAGVNVPEFQKYIDADGKPVKIAKFVEGKTLAEVRASGGDVAGFVKKAQAHFYTDALMGNWDVIGLSADNILIDNAGAVWRIDNGGALGYRAQGSLKGSAFTENPLELITMRKDKTHAAQAVGVFGDVDIFQLADQHTLYGKTLEANLNLISDAGVRETMRKRLESARTVFETVGDMRADQWKSGYTDLIAEYMLRWRQEGVVEEMPASLHGALGAVTFKDSAGKEFDSLRGSNGIMRHAERVVTNTGGNYQYFSEWSTRQAGSSWSEPPLMLKYRSATAWRNTPVKDYFWRLPVAEGEKAFKDNVPDAGIYDRTFAAMHAFNIEFLRKTTFLNNDTVKRTLKLGRTEDIATLRDKYKVDIGQKGVQFKRGAWESTSISRPVYPYGNTLTVYTEVPHHRVLSNYFFSKGANSHDMFYGDGENEFVVMLEGLGADVKAYGGQID